MAREDLTATLGVDGRPFQLGIGNALAGASRSVSRAGRRIGSQLSAAILAVVGVQMIRGLISETQKWAKDTAKVREEYAKMGVIVSDEFADKMVKTGREAAALSMQWKVTMLPAVAYLADKMLLFLQYLKESKAVWQYMYEHNFAAHIENAATVLERVTRIKNAPLSMLANPRMWPAMVAGASGSGVKAVREHGEKPNVPFMEALGRAGELRLTMREEWEEWRKKITDILPDPGAAFSLSRGGSGAGRLASIGGDVGGLNDRVVNIEKEQVRILKQIASNTRARTPGSGGLEIPTS